MPKTSARAELDLPLDGVRVVDLTRVLAGPFATMMLADLGADVVKVERPGRGDETRYWGPPFLRGTATYFVAVNRNKRGVTLDLARDRGRQALARLLARADVLVSNFRHGALARLGLEPERLAREHPGLIQCAIVGYRSEDPRAATPSYDLLVQGDSGLMEVTGDPAGPPTKVGISIADEVAGMYVVQAVLAALLRRARTGSGAAVEVPLNETMLSMFTYQAQRYLTAGVEPTRLGNEHPSLVPYRPYTAKDGTLIVAVASQAQWESFCRAAALDALLDDPDFADSGARLAHRERLESLVEDVLRGDSVAGWIERLRTAGVPCGRVRGLAGAIDEERDLSQTGCRSSTSASVRDT